MMDPRRRKWSNDSALRDIRVRFRGDLTVVHESDDSGRKAQIRIVDPRSGKQFSFSEREYFLCQAADGQKSIETVQEEYKARFEHEIPRREVIAFYRRLRVLGLVEREAAAEPHDAGGGEARALPAPEAEAEPEEEEEEEEEAEEEEDAPPHAPIHTISSAAARGPAHDAPREEDAGQPSIAGASPAPAAGRQPISIVLFRPERLLAALHILFYPVKYLHWLIWPGVLFAGLTLMFRWEALAIDMATILSHSSTVGKLALSLVTANLVARLAQGVVIRAYGGNVSSMGITLLFGFVPRFTIDKSAVAQFDRRGQLYSHGAPLLARLALFALGTLVWATYRGTGTSLSEGALILAQMGFWAFAITAMPLLPADGYHWVAAFLNQPKLREKSLLILRARLKGQELPPAVAGEDTGRYVLFAVAILLSAATFVFGMLVYAAILLEARFQGPGVLMFLGLCGAFGLWVAAIRAKVKRAKEARASGRGGGGLPPGMARQGGAGFGGGMRGGGFGGGGMRGGGFGGGRMGGGGLGGGDMGVGSILDGLEMEDQAELGDLGDLGDGDAEEPALLGFGGGQRAQAFRRRFAPQQAGMAPAQDEAQPGQSAKRSTTARTVWLIILASLLGVAFLPYTYDTGGNFSVLPAQRAEVTARTDGEVLAIFVREGDPVEKGALLAQLSSWDQERDVAVAAASLDKARADLASLEAGPKPEAVDLAESEVAIARSTVASSRADMERARELIRSETISQQALEKAEATYEKDVAELNAALANLELVKSGATEYQIAAAEAEVTRLTHDLAYRQGQLERTRVVATAAGRVVTPNVHLLLGKYLSTGELFLEIEDSRTVEVVIDVPETDIGLVAVGDPIRLKAWGFSDDTAVGTVATIAPTADNREFGEVVRVKAVLDNADGRMRSDMTGFAKIEGADMRVWEAYLRLFVRFFQVEVWSWIP